MLSASQYLPSEVLQYSNYPEVYEIKYKIDDFQKRLVPLMAAVSDYDQGIEDYIYVTISDVQSALDLCFEITDYLGMAPNVCYDILLPLRDAQESLNELLFSFKYEEVPVVIDKQRIALRALSIDTLGGEVIGS